MEEDPEEHLHPLDQRASEMRQQADRGPAAGPGRRPEAYRPPGDPQPQEDVQSVQREAHLQADEAGERVRCSGVPG